LLVLPKVPQTGAKAWTSIVNDPFQDAPELDVSKLTRKELPAVRAGRNDQAADVFTQEEQTIRAGIRQVRWLRPSLDDLDREPTSELLASEGEDGIEMPLAVGAGRLRGLVLHKLMEEVLTGEVADDVHSLVGRARDLLSQLVVPDERVAPDPQELGATIARTLAHADIAPLRHGLVPEISVFSTLAETEVRSLSGRADALFIQDGEPQIVIDWKSDVGPSDSDIADNVAQLRVYMRATRAKRGALVYLSSGHVRWLSTAEAS
jgi:hypothetical protein